MIPPPTIEDRLRAHVEEILRRTHVPAADRDDVAEELYGHLVEHWTAAVADGADAGDAARTAIRHFGNAERIGGDLTRTYRGKLFASTIGPLLPAKAPSTSLPSLGRMALAWNVLLLSALAAGDALEQLTALTPIRAVATGFAWAVAAGILMIICLALLRSQRWAVVVGAGVVGASALDGAVSFARDPSDIPLGGLFAALVLGVAWLDRRSLWASTAGGRRAPRLLVGAVIALLTSSLAVGPLLAAVEDPLEASEEHLDLSVRVRCDEADEPSLGQSVPRWTVDVFWEWSRTTILPGGLRGWQAYTDTIVLRHPGDEWVLVTTRPPEEAGSRRPVGWLGTGPPSESAVPGDLTSAVVDFAIQSSETHPHVRYQAAWVMQGQTWTTEWPAEAEAWYFHGDEWALVATAGCGEINDGEAATSDR